MSNLIGVEPRSLRILELRYLEDAAPHAKIISAEETVELLRVIKDAQELEWMHRAVDIAQRALTATLPAIKIGMTEKQIAAELTVQLLRSGSDPDMPFSTNRLFRPKLR